jgi:hypothetical protein
MIIHETATTGQTLDFFAYKGGLVYNGSVFETPDEGNITTYRIEAAEDDGNGVYHASLPEDTTFYELRVRDSTFSASTVLANGQLGMNLLNISGSPVSTSTAQLGVNVVKFGDVTQTGRDIGASVLLSTGTGTGQLDFTSGIVKSNMVQIDGNVTNANNATLNLKQLNIVNSNGHALVAQSTGGAGDGIRATGAAGGTGITANIAGNLNGTVSSVTGNVNGNVVGTVGSLAAQAKTDVFNQVVAAIESLDIEPGLNIRQSLAIIGAAVAGVLTEESPGVIEISAMNNAETIRITASVNRGERLTVTLNPPA